MAKLEIGYDSNLDPEFFVVEGLDLGPKTDQSTWQTAYERLLTNGAILIDLSNVDTDKAIEDFTGTDVTSSLPRRYSPVLSPDSHIGWEYTARNTTLVEKGWVPDEISSLMTARQGLVAAVRVKLAEKMNPQDIVPKRIGIVEALANENWLVGNSPDRPDDLRINLRANTQATSGGVYSLRAPEVHTDQTIFSIMHRPSNGYTLVADPNTYEMKKMEIPEGYIFVLTGDRLGALLRSRPLPLVHGMPAGIDERTIWVNQYRSKTLSRSVQALTRRREISTLVKQTRVASYQLPALA